jgi:hypothetical protein
LGSALPTAGPTCGSEGEGPFALDGQAALGTSATVAMAGSGTSVVGEDELFPFVGRPQIPQNASPSLTSEPQLLQLVAI